MAEKAKAPKKGKKAEEEKPAAGAMLLADIPGLVADMELTDKTRLVGMVSPFRGETWAHLRKYVESNAYTGLTQSGVAMRKEGWEAMEKIFIAFPELPKLEIEGAPEKEWGRIEKSRTVSIVVRTLKDQGTSPGMKVDVREWVEGGKYTGWTKKGVRFGAEHLPLLLPLMAKITEALAKAPRPEPMVKSPEPEQAEAHE